MNRRDFLGGVAATLLAVGIPGAAGAAKLEVGAMRRIKPKSIWFEDADTLTLWQELKGSGEEASLAAFEEEVLTARSAWQFIEPQNVKVLGFDPDANQVQVEMTTSGRMEGTIWFLDADALQD
jgi:hypothetical protein